MAALAARVAELEAGLAAERSRCAALQAELAQLPSGGGASGSACTADACGCAAPAASAAAAGANAAAADAAAAGAAGAAAPDAAAAAADAGDETVTIGRRSLELLRLKELALDEVNEGITIADFTLPDSPLIYANAGFARITGHSQAYAVGKNCRFLQGAATDMDTVADLRRAVGAGQSCVVTLNVRRSVERRRRAVWRRRVRRRRRGPALLCPASCCGMRRARRRALRLGVICGPRGPSWSRELSREIHRH